MSDFDLIETPENVELERRLAGIGSRFIAGLLDSLILVGAYMVLYILLMVIFGWQFWTPAPGEAGMVVLALLIVLAFLIYWGYFVFFELRSNGQSPGKKIENIRVVKDGGGAVTFTDVAIRNLLRVVDGIGVYVVAGLVMFVSRKGQRLGDLAAGTVVISEAGSNYAARTDKKVNLQWERQASAAALRATGLSPEEYRLLSNYWLRRHQLSFEARQRVLPRLLRPILQRLGKKDVPNPSLPALEQEVALLMHMATAAEENDGAPTPEQQEPRP